MSQKLPKTNSCKNDARFVVFCSCSQDIHVTIFIEQISLQFVTVSCGDLPDLFFTFFHSFLKAIFLLFVFLSPFCTHENFNWFFLAAV